MQLIKRYALRLIFYFGGLFIVTLGVAVSVKSNFGVSPVSSIPYSITCIWGMEMGLATILYHCALVLLQALMLRKRFEWKSLLQIPVGVVFGYFTTFCNYLASFLPVDNLFWVRLCMIPISTTLVAIGLFFYVPANIIPLASEGIMLALAKLTKLKFSTAKIIFDVSSVVISLVLCLIFLHTLGSVGIGTVVSAFLVGLELKALNRLFGKQRDRALSKQANSGNAA